MKSNFIFTIKEANLKETFDYLKSIIDCKDITNFDNLSQPDKKRFNHFKNLIKLQIRGQETSTNNSPAVSYIPDGNHYLNIYDYTGQNVINTIDLYVNSEYQITLGGFPPLFVYRTYTDHRMEWFKTHGTPIQREATAVLEFLTIESVLGLAIVDSVRMIRDKQYGSIKGQIIREAIAAVRKTITEEMPTTPNSLLRAANRVHYIGLHKKSNGDLIEGGNWTYKKGTKNDKCNFSDGLKAKCDIDEFERFTEDYNIYIGAGSEQSAGKGSWVVFTQELEDAKRAFKGDKRLAPIILSDSLGYRHQCFWTDKDGTNHNIFGEAKKCYQREKSMISSFRSRFANNDINKEQINEKPSETSIQDLAKRFNQ